MIFFRSVFDVNGRGFFSHNVDDNEVVSNDWKLFILVKDTITLDA
jgi:hypothetical protein